MARGFEEITRSAKAAILAAVPKALRAQELYPGARMMRRYQPATSEALAVPTLSHCVQHLATKSLWSAARIAAFGSFVSGLNLEDGSGGRKGAGEVALRLCRPGLAQGAAVCACTTAGGSGAFDRQTPTTIWGIAADFLTWKHASSGNRRRLCKHKPPLLGCLGVTTLNR